MNIPLIHSRNKGKAIIVGYVFFCVLYTFSSHINFHSPRHCLSPIDKIIPFFSWTIWIYLSQFIFLFLALWICHDSIRRTIVYFSMLLSTCIACLLFIFIPIEFPHQPIFCHGINKYLWHLLYLTDTSMNCFPSLHVTFSILAAYALYIKNPYWKWIAPVWALLISISTLTTKQHYIVDMVGGIILALVTIMLVKYFIFSERIHENTH